MKKLLLLVLMIAGFGVANAQTRFGGQLDISTSSYAGFGFGANAEFFINDKMAIQPMFDYFLEKDFYNTWTISANFNYYFTETGSMKVYGIGGLVYYNWSSSVSTGSGGAFGIPSTVGTSASGIGLDLGIGSTFGDSNVLPFAEAKFMSGVAGLVLTAGLKFGAGN